MDFMRSNQSDRMGNQVIRVRDALIEEVVQDRNVGYVTISYGEMGKFNMIHILVVQLLVGRDTVLQNQFGQEILLRDLKKGMSVDAEFSSAMTASEPPQARAFRIVALRENDFSNIIVDRVMLVDTDNSFFITGNTNDINSQIRFNVTDTTIILNQRGNRICLCSLRPGQMVRVEHASFMTFSIPPQTTAYHVRII